MTRRALIVHGTGGHPDNVWYPWLAGRLSARGYAVERPHLPDLNIEPVATSLRRLLDGRGFDAGTVLVGHSAGAALLLALLEHLDAPVAQAVLVAGYATPPNTADEPVLQESYDWEKIRANAGDLVLVNSVHDPYGCDAEQGRAMFDRLGGTLVLRDDGHFGDGDQPYPEFPLLERLVLQGVPAPSPRPRTPHIRRGPVERGGRHRLLRNGPP
jgi:predicted alpha/beta hydrolase family esterase